MTGNRIARTGNARKFIYQTNLGLGLGLGLGLMSNFFLK